MKTKEISKNEQYNIKELGLLLADLDDISDLTQTDVLVRSKDYFVTLATKLDKLSLELKPRQRLQKDALQQIVEELLYLQNHYLIQKKATKLK
jgi:hypothetical protein